MSRTIQLHTGNQSLITGAALSISASLASALTGGTAGYIPLWSSATAQSSSAIFQNANNIGIGTTSPDANLTVQGQASFNSGSLSNPGIAARGDLNTGIYFPAADRIGFVVGGVEVVRLDSNGNLILGGTSAVGLFTAIGSTNGPLTLAYLGNQNLGSSATARMRFDTQGGSAHIELLRSGGTLVFNVNSADRWQISNTGHFLAGTDNSFDIGASGANRPRNIYTGADAFIAGVRVGLGAGAISTNTAVGASALAANTTGTDNTAVGSFALPIATTGVQQTAVGGNALFSTTTGTQNTALGRDALYSNTTGSLNVACGRSALVSATAANNTALGDAAGSAITTGARNTLLGRYSGNQDGLDLRTANNNIVLSDGDGNARMYYDGTSNFWAFRNGGSERMRLDASGNLGIGTNTPGAKLHIQGNVSASSFIGDGASLTGVASSASIGWEYITKATLSNTTTVDFSLDNSTYKVFHIIMTNVSASSAFGQVYLEMSTNSGSSFVANTSQFFHSTHTNAVSAGSVSGPQQEGILNTATVGTSAPFNGDILLYPRTGGMQVQSRLVYINGSSQLSQHFGTTSTTAGTINFVRLRYVVGGSNNALSSGSIYLLGRRT